MLGAVVLEDPMDVGGPRDQGEVPEEDPDPDQALDEVLDQVVLDVRGRHAGDEQRQQEEDPDAGHQGESEHQRDRALAQLDALLLALDVRAADQPAGADDERLVEDDQPADERPLRRRRAVDARFEPLGRRDDAAVRMAERDGDRVAATHEDAFDERLAAVRIGGMTVGRDG